MLTLPPQKSLSAVIVFLLGICGQVPATLRELSEHLMANTPLQTVAKAIAAGGKAHRRIENLL